MKGYISLIAFCAALATASITVDHGAVFARGGCTTNVDSLACCCLCAGLMLRRVLDVAAYVNSIPFLLILWLTMAAIVEEILPLRRS